MLIQAMGDIYNENIDVLSAGKDLKKNSPEEQEAWFREVSKPPCLIEWFLFSRTKSPWDVIGFIQMTWHPPLDYLKTGRSGYSSHMMAFSNKVQGKGYGYSGLEFYRKYCNGIPLRAVQLADNSPIARLHEFDKWEVVQEGNGLQHVFHSNGSKLGNERVEPWQ